MQNNFSHKVVNKKNTSIQFDDNSRVIPNKSPSSCVLWLALPFAFYVRSPFVQRALIVHIGKKNNSWNVISLNMFRILGICPERSHKNNVVRPVSLKDIVRPDWKTIYNITKQLDIRRHQ